MSQRIWVLIAIILVLVVGVYVNIPNTPCVPGRDCDTELGLDLQGGLQVLMEADVPANVAVDPAQLNVAREIMENRSNALGVSEVTYQTAGERRLVGEYPGVTNVEEILQQIQVTGQLEFVDFGSNPVLEGTVVQTDYLVGGQTAAPAATEPAVTATADPTAAAPTEAAPTDTVYHTVMTGEHLRNPLVGRDPMTGYYVSFQLDAEGQRIFSEYTSNNVGRYLGIVLDKTVISAPRVETPITEPSGQISGNFTLETANALAVNLRYGSLPIPLKIVETRQIGPTLGQDSLQKSLLAGVIGLTIIVLFMGIYYRLPGLVANLSILFFALMTLTLIKLIPITLTLPGIAGVMLSTGSALDANILIFERLKEELRSGKQLVHALPQAFRRAWPSIRDSNLATLLTCAVLYLFGSQFGATIVKGFAVTLALGVAISLFTALVVTRTFMNVAVNWFKPTNLVRWFGI